jgi:predicted phage-related endonuclease
MERKGFIGGSDCVKIMQGNWLELWQVKTGRVEPEDLSRNIAVQMGVHTEDFNLHWFEHEHNCVLTGWQKSFKKKIGMVPAQGTVDATLVRAIDGSWDKSIIEAKHTNAYNTMDKVLEFYMPQLQLYIHVADAQGAYLSVIFGNNKWESVHVSRNEEYFNSMWAVVSDFWGYVLRNEEPVGNDQPIQLSIDKVSVDNMVKRNATSDNQFVDAAITYIENEAAAKTFESAKKQIKDMVGDNEREVYCDQLTAKRDKRGAIRITRRTEK